MNQEEFVEAIQQQVGKVSIKAVMELLEEPPGRSPAENLKNLSRWYNSSSEEQKLLIKEVVKMATDMSIFSFLCILDGVRAIENDSDKGQLFLYYEKNGERILLNDQNSDFLHDLL